MIIDLSGIDQEISLALQAYTAMPSLSFLHLTAHLGDISRSEHKEQPDHFNDTKNVTARRCHK